VAALVESLSTLGPPNVAERGEKQKGHQTMLRSYVTKKQEMVDDDPTQGRRHGEHPDDDPTQGRQYGERPDDDLTRRGRRSEPHQPISPSGSSRGPAVAEPRATLPRPTLRGAGTHDETDPRTTPPRPTLRGAGTHDETDPRARPPSPTLRGAGERH
jgi:hypothetical protein